MKPSKAYAWSVLTVAFATTVGRLMFPHFHLSNIVMVYLLGVVFVAARFGRGPSIVASILSVAAFDILFVPPYFSFTVDDAEYVITFGIMLVVALFTSGLVVRLQQQAKAACLREHHTNILYRMSREFSRAVGREEIVLIAEQKMGELLGADVWVLLSTADGKLDAAPGITSAFPLEPEEKRIADWVLVSGRPAGRDTEDFPKARALYIPIAGARARVGVLGIFEHEAKAPSRERRHLLEAIAGQLALALERDSLADEAQEARLHVEADKLRDTLLSSVSHDLRTPLATIGGAASALLASDGTVGALDDGTRRDMTQSIWEESERLNRLVNNLLQMTRLQSGALHVRKQWHPIDEVVGAALTALRRRLDGRTVQVRAPEDLPLVPMDGVLIEQVLINLIENALRHAGPGRPIEIEAMDSGGEIVTTVADRGPGIPAGEEERIFRKFGRAPGAHAGSGGGVGLGLAICRGIVEQHGGRIWAVNREGGGAVFAFALPLGEGAPATFEESEPDEVVDAHAEPRRGHGHALPPDSGCE